MAPCSLASYDSNLCHRKLSIALKGGSCGPENNSLQLSQADDERREEGGRQLPDIETAACGTPANEIVHSIEWNDGKSQ